MKWLKNNTVELVLGISGSLFLINHFTDQDEAVYALLIPFLVLGFILLYKRHFLKVKAPHQVACANPYLSTFNEDGEDELYEEAKEAVIEVGKASTSYLQRKLRVGYSRSARLMDMLEENGVIGPADGSKPRKVIEEDNLVELEIDDNELGAHAGGDIDKALDNYNELTKRQR